MKSPTAVLASSMKSAGWASGGTILCGRVSCSAPGAKSKVTPSVAMPASPSIRAVMHLDIDRKGVVLESFDEVVLPKRAAAVERNGVQPGDQGPQLLHAPGLRQGLVGDVVVEIDFFLTTQAGWSMPSGVGSSRRRNYGRRSSRAAM